MSNPLELLAMMAPKGIELGKPVGGVPSICPQDVAHGLARAHLTREEYLLLLAKYAGGEVAVVYELCNRFYYRAVELASDEFERDRGVPRLRNLSAWVVGEHIGLNRCAACGGSGKTFHQKDCASCGGRQFVWRSGAWLSEHIVMINRSNWVRRGWEAYYQRLGRELTAWDSLAVRKYRNAMEPDDREEVA